MEDNFDKLLDDVMDDLLTLSGAELLAEANSPENEYVFCELAKFEAIFFGGYSSMTSKRTEVHSTDYTIEATPSVSHEVTYYNISSESDEEYYLCAA